MKSLRLSVLFIPLLLFIPGELYSQGCPKGVRYNCVYGCGRHIDLNNDGYCDYSFVTVGDKSEADGDKKSDSLKTANKDTATAAASTTNSRPSTESRNKPTDKSEHKKNVREAESETTSNDVVSEPTGAPGVADQDGRVCPEGITPPLMTDFIPQEHGPVYRLISLSILTLSLYFLSYFLYKRNIIKRIHHRKFWNLLLLLTFLVSCLFGLFLIVQINYHIAMGIYGTLLIWHVEVGIAMTLIAIIHILWHLTYFKNMLKKW